MSINKTCAISSLRSRPVSALIYGFADFSKHESGLPLSLKFRLEQQKIEKICGREFPGHPLCAKEKAGRFLREQIIPTPELEYLPSFKQTVA